MTNVPCTAVGCENPGVTILRNTSFCCNHFIAHCYEELGAYSQTLAEHRLTETATVSARSFVQECLRQADVLESDSRYLDDAEKERLADIILLASELGRNLRRSPRKPMAIQLLLSSELPNAPWEEKTNTQFVSRHGALVHCRHAARVDQTMMVKRLDTGQRDKARVAWSREKSAGNYELGIEFPDNENFWGIDWGPGS
jgi:hypothetical protein